MELPAATAVVQDEIVVAGVVNSTVPLFPFAFLTAETNVGSSVPAIEVKLSALGEAVVDLRMSTTMEPDMSE